MELNAAQAPEPKPRLDFLDVVTGIMLTHMMLVHLSGFADLIRAPFYYTFTFYDAAVQGLFFFMPWFYFKAGVFINRKGRPSLLRDAKRLLVPWLSFTALGFVAFFALGILQGNCERGLLLSQAKSLVQNGAVEGNLALWFLPSLFLVRLLYRTLPERFLPATLALSLLAAAGLWRFGVELPFTLATVPAGFSFLLLGHYSKKLVMSQRIKYAGWGGQQSCHISRWFASLNLRQISG